MFFLISGINIPKIRTLILKKNSFLNIRKQILKTRRNFLKKNGFLNSLKGFLEIRKIFRIRKIIRIRKIFSWFKKNNLLIDKNDFLK